ncbi:hypothetical protein [Chryseobacterium sp. CP-77]|uniref:hypothetical protein n=1 Tax=Chryseobacterium sp. CP-77 TaxID=3116594 RepID=UPI002ED466AE
MKNIRFNLTKILNNVNSKINSYEKVELLLDHDSICFRTGGIVYFCDHKKFLDVLEVNEFSYDNSDAEDLDIDLLGKHIVNQLTAAIGRKFYPEIKTLSSDLNQN